MTLTTEESIEFESAVKPLMKWLSENCHPHSSVIVLLSSILKNS